MTDPLVTHDAEALRQVRLELTRAAWTLEVAMAECLRIANQARRMIGMAPLPADQWRSVVDEEVAEARAAWRELGGRTE